ncbi:DNA polymerase III subunit gamma and tau [Flexivirga sp. B27]
MTTALYRRYRPDAFGDMIGQDQVTQPLMRALSTGRVGHAYLFSGPRGCGKTTSARVLARSLNCEQGPTPTPCGVCESCVALARGGAGTVDVIEIDAASHGGVDDARDLRERASYGPAQSRYKIYIIDEAHMVTPQGFNALLKIVEEPPEHVKFIFATTEPDKVIGTIRSRTHHYPFRLVPPGTMQTYLEQLCEAEGVQVEPGVLSFVVRAGGGSFRDALSVLDQLIAGSGEEGLTYAGAAALLGFTDGELLDATVDALGARDSGAVFRQIDRVIESGHDPRRFVEDLLERLRDLIVIAAVPDGAAQVLRGVPEDQLDRMRQQAASFGPGELSRAADIVNTGLSEMTGATGPRLQLELICARVLLPAVSGEQGYAARLDRLERRMDIAGTSAAQEPGEHSPEGGRVAARNEPRIETPPDQHAARDEPQTQGGPVAAREDSQTHGGPVAAREDTQTQGGRVAARDESHPQGGRVAAREDSQTHGGPVAAREDSQTQGGRVAARDESHPQGGRVAARDDPQTQGGRVAAREDSQTQGGRVAARNEPHIETPPDPQPEQPAASQPPQPAPAGAVSTDAVRRAWPDVLDRIARSKRVTWALLSQHAHVADFDGETLVLGTSSPGLASAVERAPHPDVVAAALYDALGVRARVTARPDAGAPSPSLPPEPDEGPSGGAPRGPGGPSGAPGGPQQQDSQSGPGSAQESGGRPSASAAPPTTAQPPAQDGASTESASGGWSPSAPTAPSPDHNADTSAPPAAEAAAQPARRSRAAEALAQAGLSAGSGATDSGGGWGSVSAPPPEWATAENPAAPAKSSKAGKPKDEEITESMDDEDVDDPGAVGLPVMQAVLGATVIDEQVD